MDTLHSQYVPHFLAAVRYARRHRLRGGKARRPAFMAHGSRLRALHPAALVTLRHRNVADGYCCGPYLLLLLPFSYTIHVQLYSCTSTSVLPVLLLLRGWF